MVIDSESFSETKIVGPQTPHQKTVDLRIKREGTCEDDLRRNWRQRMNMMTQNLHAKKVTGKGSTSWTNRLDYNSLRELCHCLFKQVHFLTN